MKEKIKLGIPIENEKTGETNVILRTNEIRIVEEAFDEIERLNKALLNIKELVVNNACLDDSINKCVDDLIYYKCDELLDIVNKALGSEKE